MTVRSTLSRTLLATCLAATALGPLGCASSQRILVESVPSGQWVSVAQGDAESSGRSRTPTSFDVRINPASRGTAVAAGVFAGLSFGAALFSAIAAGSLSDGRGSSGLSDLDELGPMVGYIGASALAGVTLLLVAVHFVTLEEATFTLHAEDGRSVEETVSLPLGDRVVRLELPPAERPRPPSGGR